MSFFFICAFATRHKEYFLEIPVQFLFFRNHSDKRKQTTVENVNKLLGSTSFKSSLAPQQQNIISSFLEVDYFPDS